MPRKYQHRVLFWGIFGALVLRAIFIFAGVALIEKFDWILYLFGAFLLYTAAKLVRQGEQHRPGRPKFLKLVHRFVPSTTEYDGQKLFTKQNGRRLATPLFAVLVLIEATDVIFAVDSVPAVLAVSHEQFIVFARMRSRSSACGRCTSCSPTCIPGSATSRRAWRSSSPSSASRC